DGDLLGERDVLEVQVQDVPLHGIALDLADQRLPVRGRSAGDLEVHDDVGARGAVDQRLDLLRVHDERERLLASPVVDRGYVAGGAELLRGALADAGPLLAVQTRDGHVAAPLVVRPRATLARRLR